jgi:hypothetical protein
MSEQKPSPGRIVLVSDAEHNGVTEHPAIITRVWSDTCINVTVFPDCWAPFCKTSVEKSEDESREQKDTWRWPPRV